MIIKRFLVAVVAVAALSACTASEEPDLMPSVTGLTLDVALSDLERAGLSGEPEILGGGLFGVIEEANWVVCEQVPAAGEPMVNPRLSVDRECEGGEPAEEPSEAPSGEPSPEATVAAEGPYEYAGPDYETVTVDREAGFGVLDQHWIYTDELDTSSGSYREAVKLIIEDVARGAGTEELIVQVVTDKEIVEAESTSTGPSFMEAHDQDYWNDVMVPKEAEHWVAWYTGGYDYDESELSDADVAYGIDWWAAGDYEHEQWKASIGG